MSKDTAFNAETTPRHTFLCSDSQCLPPGDPRILCAKHGYPITGKSFIKPPNGHIRLGVKHFGFEDWAKAIFLSPSIAYASNSCYSEHIWSSGENWCILIKALVEPTSYTKHDPTLLRYNPIEGEPEATEYRIQVSEGDAIMRVESGRHVVVRSIVFISLDFLQKTPNLHFEELMSCFDHKHLF